MGVVALDMCTLVGTDNPDNIHERRWFRNYYNEAMGGPGSCDASVDIELAYVPAQAACTVLESTKTDSVEPSTLPAETSKPVSVEPSTTDSAKPSVTDSAKPSTSAPAGPTATKSDETKSSSALAQYSMGFVFSILAGVMATMLA